MEVLAQMRNELRVARMIRRFNTDDPLLQGVVVLLHVPEEVQLRLRRTDQQDLTVTFERLGDLAKEPRLIVGMIPHSHVLFVGVPMNVKTRSVDDRLLDPVGVDFEYAGLLLIDPYDCVLHDDLLHDAPTSLNEP